MSKKLPPTIQCVPMELERHSSAEVAELIYASAPDLFDLILGRAAVSCLAELVRRSHNRFSYRHVCVAEADSRVVGIVLKMPASELNENADYPSVLGRWRHLRLQLAYALLLDRILKHDYPPDTVYVANLAVHPESRGQGIGTQLLLQCIADAQSAKAAAVFISVSIDNPRAQQLYESLGFEVVAVRTIRLLSAIVGTRVLRLPLKTS